MTWRYVCPKGGFELRAESFMQLIEKKELHDGLWHETPEGRCRSVTDRQGPAPIHRAYLDTSAGALSS